MEQPDTLISGQLPSLHVLLRTHSTGNFHPQTPRLTDTMGGKSELTMRTLKSLIRGLALAGSAAAVRLTVLDDHSDNDTILRMQALLDGCAFPAELVLLAESGNAQSLRATFEAGRSSQEELCYFVEDDYLHEETAIIEMLEMYAVCRANMKQDDVALFPLDNIWRYGFRGMPIEETRVVLGSRRHWRVVTKATCTFMLPRATVEKYWEFIIRGAIEETYEQGMTTNYMWEHFVPLLSPIPTLAYHIHDIPDTPGFTDWRRLWGSLA